ncbi:hypothetical protein ACIQM4_06290 [Streptomyces sp. NPDC091272]
MSRAQGHSWDRTEYEVRRGTTNTGTGAGEAEPLRPRCPLA